MGGLGCLSVGSCLLGCRSVSWVQGCVLVRMRGIGGQGGK